MRRRFRLLVVMLCAAALVSGLNEAVAFVVAPHAAPAKAASAATGTGGQFVATQGRVLDTRPATQVGPYNSAMPAGVWRSVQIAGTTMSDGSQLPASISAVSVNISVIGPSAAGYICADKDGSSPRSTAVVRYTSTDDQANTATLPVAANGKIALKAATVTNLIVEVQGYYTADDGVAPGGYVPVTPKRIRDTYYGIGGPAGKLSSGSTTTIQVASADSGVPAGATAAILNITTSYDTSTKNHYYVPYPADEQKPAGWSSSFPIGDTDANEMHVGLSTTGSPLGAIKFFLSQASSYTVHIQVDVLGYFTPGTAKGAFTPATARVYATGTYDTNTPKRSAIAPGATVKVQVGGVNGVPIAGSGISAVSIQLNVLAHGTHGGYTEMWASGKPRPSPYSSVNLSRSGYFIGNLVTTQLGDDGAVNIFNQSQDAIDVLVDVEGWYSGVGGAVISGQTKTPQSLSLQADASTGGPWVSYQYRNGTDGAFVDVPTSNVRDADGKRPSSWPVEKQNSKFAAYAWNIRDSLAALPANNGVAPDSAFIQVQACYGSASNDQSPVCNMPTNVEFAQSEGGDATTEIGPGAVSELTGNFTLGETDADVASAFGSLGVNRTLSTLRPAAATNDARGIFGPGWTAELSDAAGGLADSTVTDNSAKHYISLTDAAGVVTTYVDSSAATTYPMTFEPAGSDAGDDTSVWRGVVAGVDTVTATDADGTKTTWKKTGSPAQWRSESVTSSDSVSTTRYSYGTSGSTNGLVTRIQAPSAKGTDCSNSPDTTPGCRGLILSYTSAAPVRLSSVKLSIPQSATENKITVAEYSYDSSGRLSGAWDPRLQPALVTKYQYTSNNRLSSFAPPGLSAWSLTYDSTGRLSTVSRPGPTGTNATNTVVYDIPIATAEGGPVALGSSTTAAWGQTEDVPVTGTAVFGADRKPAGTTPAQVSDIDWPYAEIDYLDVNGRTVNSAEYGAGDWRISAVTYNATGGKLWSISPGNLAQALSPTDDTDSFVRSTPGSAARAALLSSTVTYEPLDATQATDTFDPTHPIVLTDGRTIHGRTHVVTSYDEQAPNDGINPATQAAYGLPTTVTTTSYQVDGNSPGDTAGADSKTVRTGYDPVQAGDVSGWDSGVATRTTTVMTGSSTDLTTKSRYNEEGRLVEERLSNDDGTGPRTTLTSYYTSSGSGPCVDPARVGLVCTTEPAGQPATGSPLPTTRYTYDQYGKPTVVTQTYGTGSNPTVRTSTTTYDAAERVVSTSTSVTPVASGGTALPAVKTTYAGDTGLTTAVSTTTNGVTTSLKSEYDNLGRIAKYTDATGTVSTTTYDGAGNVLAKNNGKHTTTYTTDDALSEHRGLLTAQDIGLKTSPSVFTATYDAAGNMAMQTYPNGLVATRHYDNADNLTSLAYSKDGNEWLAFTQVVNALGKIAKQTSPKSAQVFRYDAADRLTDVRDTYGNACVTRSYKFDDHSNRTELTTVPAGSGGACGTTGGATTRYEYDSADRLVADNPGGSYVYDDLGRTSASPAADATATGTHAAAAGSLMSTYYNNDMVASQRQGTSTIAFDLDPSQDRVLRQTEGAKVTVNHYDDDSDSPSWSATGSAWTENCADLKGDLAVTISQDGTVLLNLLNPHGDVVATVPNKTDAIDVVNYFEATEFGAPRNASQTFTPYSWLGGAQRSSDVLGGAMLMGARVYAPSTGRFLSVDSIAGGNANDYVYPQDPINAKDLDGRCASLSAKCLIKLLTTREPWPPGFFAWIYNKKCRKCKRGDPMYGGNTKAGYRWMRNGDHCTDSRDHGRAFDFVDACDTHDLGYDLMEFLKKKDRSRRHLAKAKRAVDKLFLSDMKADCRGRWYINRKACKRRANVYYKAVRRFGEA